MKGLTKIVFSILCVLIIKTSPLYATTYVVDSAKGTGYDFTTVSSCASVAAAGDTCSVRSGTYEGFTPNSGSADGGYVTFIAADGQSPVITSKVNVLNKSYIVIDGFTFSGANIDGLGSAGQRGSHLKITNNIFSGISGRNIELNHDDVLISGNYSEYIMHDFILAIGHRIAVVNNTILEANDVNDVHLDFFQSWADPTANVNLQDVLIEGNTFMNTSGGNTHFFLDNDNSGSSEPCTRIITRFNKVYDLASVGFSVLDKNNSITSTRNTVYNNTVYKAYAGNSGNNAIVTYTASTNSSAINNIMYDAQWPIGAQGFYFASGGAQSYNLYYDPDTSMTFSGLASDETGAIKNKDPLITVTQGGDFSIASDSPARDAGGPLTTAIGSGSNSKSLTVDKSEFFQYGLAPGVQADWVAVGTVDNASLISSIDYNNNVISLASSLSWSSGAKVWLYKKSDGVQVIYGSAPDIGASEYGVAVMYSIPLTPSEEGSADAIPTPTGFTVVE